MTIMRITLEFTDPTNIWEIRRRIDQLVYHLVDRGLASKGGSTVGFIDQPGGTGVPACLPPDTSNPSSLSYPHSGYQA